MTRAAVTAAMLLGAVSQPLAAPIGSVFNPRDYTPGLGALIVTNGQTIAYDVTARTWQ